MLEVTGLRLTNPPPHTMVRSGPVRYPKFCDLIAKPSTFIRSPPLLYRKITGPMPRGLTPQRSTTGGFQRQQRRPRVFWHPGVDNRSQKPPPPVWRPGTAVLASPGAPLPLPNPCRLGALPEQKSAERLSPKKTLEQVLK